MLGGNNNRPLFELPSTASVSIFSLSQPLISPLAGVFFYSLQSATFYKVFFYFLTFFFSFLPFLDSFLSFYIFSCTVSPFSQSLSKSLYLLWFINPQ